jgi:hypothetical protein
MYNFEVNKKHLTRTSRNQTGVYSLVLNRSRLRQICLRYDILKNFINKYFAKNDQRIFIKGLIISNLFQIGCLMNIGLNPLCIYKSCLMKYCVGKIATLKSTAYKGCCPEDRLL